MLEVGLGGRFDATNVIDTPLAAVIMSISLDHTAILGDTVEQIAFEKCGIVKEGGDVVLYPDQEEGVYGVVAHAVQNHNGRLVLPSPSSVREVSSSIEGTGLGKISSPPENHWRYGNAEGQGQQVLLEKPCLTIPSLDYRIPEKSQSAAGCGAG